MGDNVLQIFAEVASAKLGPYDLIGRLDGEEFAIVIYDSGRDKRLAIAERIRLSFESAAEALYCAKERGRNRTEVASLQLVLDRAQEAEQRGRPRPVAAASAPSAA